MDAPEPEVSDNHLLGLSAAPEVFVEGYRGAMMRAGVLKLNFFTNRFDPFTGRVEKHAAVTLSIPLADFEGIATGMTALLREMQEKGTAPKEDPA
jgi:hypothetical protein